MACAIVLGRTDFLGFKLNLKHQSAIYVSTEDNDKAVSALLRKQKEEGAENSDFGRLRFIFDSSNLLAKLREQLQNEPADCVIIDAFADLFDGDINSVNSTRSFLELFSSLAQKHGCTIIFLHHTGKRTEDSRPSKNNLLGSQGFEGKMRMVAELRRDPDPSKLTVRHLCIVKGNYMSEDAKHSSFALEFDSATMRFHNTGERVLFEDLVKRDTRESDETSRAKERAFTLRKEGKTIREIESTLTNEGLPGKKSLIGEWAKAMSNEGKVPTENEPQVPAPLDDKQFNRSIGPPGITVEMSEEENADD